MSSLKSPREVLARAGLLLGATAWAVLLGALEVLKSERGRRLLALSFLACLVLAIVASHPIATIPQGEAGVRANHLTGTVTELREGWALVVPGLHDLRRYPLRDQVYRPLRSARASGDGAFQTVEGLSIGVEVSVRYALDPERIGSAAESLPSNLGAELVEPLVDGVLHRVLAQHTVREIFSTRRADIQATIENDLRPKLAADGVLVKSVFLGNVDLPPQYRAGLEALLLEELQTEKMRFTLELEDKKVKEAELEAEAQKVRREKAAEAAGMEEIIAARSRAEAMKHVLPFKEKEIEQRRLEAEAQRVTRIKQAEGEAEARRIEAGGEADSRRKLAESEAYRIEVTGKASSEQLAREAVLISKNPLLIQKTLADKLSDKIQVIVAPPEAGGFFAGGLLGARASEAARSPETTRAAHAQADAASAEGREP